MSTSTLRLPDELQAEATAYAARLGISLNALCAVALRDYLDARLPVAALHRGAVPLPLPAPARLSGTKAMAALDAVTSTPNRTHSEGKTPPVPKVGANEPCPCGSGEKYKRCHGKPGA